MVKVTLIVWLACSAILVGLGIYNAVIAQYSYMAVYFAVAVGCAVLGIVRYRRARAEQKAKEEEEKDE